jgi:hypothetical protein
METQTIYNDKIVRIPEHYNKIKQSKQINILKLNLEFINEELKRDISEEEKQEYLNYKKTILSMLKEF